MTAKISDVAKTICKNQSMIFGYLNNTAENIASQELVHC